MARGRLFEYAILYHPKPTDENENPKSVLVTPPETVLAADEKEVGIRAARALTDEYMDKLEDMEIVVRPF